MIQASSLVKRYGERTVVDDVSFSVRPGEVTAFLGPNGAGKTTTMRMIVGIEQPTSGSATIGGRAYRDLASPLGSVGVLLEAGAATRGRTGRDHLRWLAASNGIADARADWALDRVGLTAASRRDLGTYSLGMTQRLGLAAALLGDPAVLILDEPANGLDPEGIIWIRTLMRDLADEGRTVLVSSHLMGEVAEIADHLLIISRGRLVADTPAAEFALTRRVESVTVRALDDPSPLLAALDTTTAATRECSGAFEVAGVSAEEIGRLAASSGVALAELTPHYASLEAAFMALTGVEPEPPTRRERQ